MASRKKAVRSKMGNKKAAADTSDSKAKVRAQAQVNGSVQSSQNVHGEPCTLETKADAKLEVKKNLNEVNSTRQPLRVLSPSTSAAAEPSTESPVVANGVKQKPLIVQQDSAKGDLRACWNAMIKAQLEKLAVQLNGNEQRNLEVLLDQDQPCSSADYNLSRARCVECLKVRSKPAESGANQPVAGSYCRFMAFRKLTFTDKGVPIATDKFRTSLDAKPEDLQHWSPFVNNAQPVVEPPSSTKLSRRSRIEVTMQEVVRFGRSDAMHIVASASSEFFRLIALELRALHFDAVAKRRTVMLQFLACQDTFSFTYLLDHLTHNAAWRTPVQECRELCDVCSTSIFNVHWICTRCGFAVCIHCYRSRLARDLRTGDQAHNASSSDLAESQFESEHDAVLSGTRKRKSTTAYNAKRQSKKTKTEEGESSSDSHSVADSATAAAPSGPFEHTWPSCALNRRPHAPESLRLAQLAPANIVWHFAKLLFNEADRFNVVLAKDFKRKRLADGCVDDDRLFIDFLLNSFGQCQLHADLETSDSNRPGPAQSIPCEASQPLEMPWCVTEARAQRNFDWLCEGRMLHIRDAQAHIEANFLAFRHFWKLARPILVSRCDRESDTKLWHPDSFTADFGSLKCELYDCETNELLRNQEMRLFWAGFENYDARLRRPLLPVECADEGATAENSAKKARILKLKDWPPYDSIEAVIPTRWSNMQRCLPLAQYTLRNGCFNLAARLPTFFARPDLGPKMYNAYGSAAARSHAGSTNLHVDISDAINLLMYVGRPTSEELHRVADYLTQINLAADMRSRLQLTSGNSNCKRADDGPRLPGALWHIFESRDSPAIRQYLRQQTFVPLNLGVADDPIHDQLVYIDERMLVELRDQFGVMPYTIVQCVGDAVFIPAGAPHQVKNLLACIKIASDFVSAENVGECVCLTDQFRRLSKRHANHEDKLQVRNMLFHALKDAVSTLAV